MTEYAIVFFSVSLVAFAILDQMFIADPVQGLSLRATIPSLGISNPLYGFKAYFERLTNFISLPIP